MKAKFLMPILLALAPLAAQAGTSATPAEDEKAALRAHLEREFNALFETRAVPHGLLMKIDEAQFDANTAALNAPARERLARVAGLLLAYSGLKIQVKGAAGGDTADGVRLAERRADAVRSNLEAHGLPKKSWIAASPAASDADAPTDTVGRQACVVLMISGDPVAAPAASPSGRQ